MRVLQRWVLCSLHPRLQSFPWPCSPADGWPARDQLRPVPPRGSQPRYRCITLVTFYLTPHLQAQNFFLRKLSLADNWPTNSPVNGSFLMFLQIAIPRRSWVVSSQGSQRMRTLKEPFPARLFTLKEPFPARLFTLKEPFPARLFTLHQPEAGDWKGTSSLSPFQSRMPLWAEDAG